MATNPKKRPSQKKEPVKWYSWHVVRACVITAILISVGVSIELLHYAYKHKQLDADYGNYAATIIAALVLNGLLVHYLVRLYHLHRKRNLKNRPKTS